MQGSGVGHWLPFREVKGAHRYWGEGEQQGSGSPASSSGRGERGGGQGQGH